MSAHVTTFVTLTSPRSPELETVKGLCLVQAGPVHIKPLVGRAWFIHHP